MVKANDPLGLTYKMQEIFEVWGMNDMAKYAFALSIGMIAFEVIAGVAVLVGNAFHTWITLMLAMNIFYLFLTWYAWSSGNVKECGCFGDCFKLSNAATFYKDVALTAINLFLFIFRFRVFPLFQKTAINVSIVGATTVFAFVFQWWVLVHLPVHDCLAYKKGNNLWAKMHAAPDATPDVYETILTYEKGGIKKDFTTEEFNAQKIWEDPKWKFVDSKSTLIKEGTGKAEIPGDFSFVDLKNVDHTEEVLTAKGFTFLLFVREPYTNTLENIEAIRNIVAKAATMHVNFYVLCTAGTEDCKNYQEIWGLKDVTFFKLDGTVSKTAMRTHQGLMLLNDGTVMGKWAPADYPKDIVLENGSLSTK
ncbi:MAG: hypothetical protein EBZ77_02425 [Chitinophagia bacterium]|nr:hypothetical protein [Chitinophagia bacterium]